MRSLSKNAKRVLESVCGELLLDQQAVISAVVELLPREELIRLAREGASTRAPRNGRAANYQRRQADGERKQRQTKYGFEHMPLGRPNRIDCPAETSLDYPIQSARMFAARRGLEYRYRRIPHERAVLIWFYDPSLPAGHEEDAVEQIGNALTGQSPLGLT